MRCDGLIFLAVWLGLMPCLALASVTLPLEGYCKIGHFFPVRVDGATGSARVGISGEGCMPVVIDGLAGSTVVPVLVEGEPRELDYQGQHLALRMPGADERLIAGLDPAQMQAAAAVFPGDRLIPIGLDAAELLAGPPVAWETLDAMVLPGDIFGRLSDFQRSTLLGCGVTLIAVGPLAPDSRWPWHQVGGMWVLGGTISGPRDDVVNANIYAATFGWMPGWSSAVRGQVMGIGALLVLGSLGLSLWRGRWPALITIALLLGACGGIVCWRHTLGTVDRAGGDVIINSTGLTQRDQYVYERARQDTLQNVPWAGCTHPLFSSQNAMDQSEMVLHQSGSGELAFSYQAKAGHTLAFLRRDVQAGEIEPTDTLHDSPMQEAAKSEYRDAEHRIVGEIPGSGDRWAGVVMKRIGLLNVQSNMDETVRSH